MTQEKADSVFAFSLGQQLDVIYSTSDDRVFIRKSEAESHAKDNNLSDATICDWYPSEAVSVFFNAQENVDAIHDGCLKSMISDGYHTFSELYEFRKVYNAALFNEWGKFDNPTYDVHKSWRHNDGELCFGGGWFIVVAVLPTGQISNHYEAKDWDLFKIPEVDVAKYPFDGHTPTDVLSRLKSIF